MNWPGKIAAAISGQGSAQAISVAGQRDVLLDGDDLLSHEGRIGGGRTRCHWESE